MHINKKKQGGLETHWRYTRTGGLTNELLACISRARCAAWTVLFAGGRAAATATAITPLDGCGVAGGFSAAGASGFLYTPAISGLRNICTLRVVVFERVLFEKC